MVVKFGEVCVCVCVCRGASFCGRYNWNTVDGPLMDHIRQFCCYFSYLFELNIQYNVFKKYHFYAIILQIWFYENVSIRPKGSILKPKAPFPVHSVFTCLYSSKKNSTLFYHLKTSMKYHKPWKLQTNASKNTCSFIVNFCETYGTLHI